VQASSSGNYIAEEAVMNRFVQQSLLKLYCRRYLMGISIDLTNTERRVSTAEFALRMNISEKELYDRIKTGRVKRPIKDGRKNFWLNSYVLTCILNEENSILTSK